ncbi:MAG: hypothetical protein JW922_08810 [Paludibacteraceae bacterium]|nr:hypothetical protein [Paludibacteraceae bacterium]
MENKDSLFDYIKTIWIENNKRSFDLYITTIEKDLKMKESDIKTLLTELIIEKRISFSTNCVRKETYHTDNLPNRVTVLEVND